MAGILARITISFVVVVFAGCAFDNGHRNVDRIYVQGEWYYVCRDSYPAKYIQFYIPHSVRVNGNTGEVIPPDSPSKY